MGVALALRRFRLPVPVRVRVEDGRPVRLTTDRHGLTGGPIVQAAGPWRTSGEWWATALEREPGVGSVESDEHRREAHGRSARAPDARFPVPGAQQGVSCLPDAVTRVPTRSQPWDRDEWDIAMADGTVYRLFVEREVGQWFLEGVFD